MGPKVVSFINLKGGVAKTTTCVGTAIALAETYHQKVLVIDLDPQTNATTMLIGEKRWKELDDKGYTIHTIFQDLVDHEHRFSVTNTVQTNVGNIKDAPGIGLVPNSIQLVYIQDELYKIRSDNGLTIDPYMVLEKHLGTTMFKYDFVLIDCPPNLGILSLNGLLISQGYVIPAVPDILSTYGVSQIVNRVEKFAALRRVRIRNLGILFTRVKGNSTLHQRMVADMRSREEYPIFQTVIPENVRYTEAAEYTEPLTFRQKWGGTKGVQPFVDFAGELIQSLKK